MIAPDDPRHGSVAGYNRIPCREACCRDAYNRWRKGWTHDRRNGRPRVLDATGCRRRVQALMALGWSIQTMADAAGTTHRTLWTMLTVATTTRAKAERVAQVYDRLSMSLPPERTHGEKVTASRARNRARREGWAPPLAWDDRTIDDPASRPATDASDDVEVLDDVVIMRALQGRPVRANRAERAEITRRWRVSGRSLAELDRVQGWNVHRDRRAA